MPFSEYIMGLTDSATQQVKATGHPYEQSDSYQLIAEINKLIYDSRRMITRDWKAGVLIIVDN